jgi:hypothetical protein
LTIRHHERGLAFFDGEFQTVLRPGRHWVFDPCRRVRVDVVSVRDVWLAHASLGAIVSSGELVGELEVVNVAAQERGVVWVNDTIEAVVGPGLHALWTVFTNVHVDLVPAGVVRPREESWSADTSKRV